MNDRSPTTTSTGPPIVSSIGVAHVAPFEIGHPVVGAEPLVQLAMADVEGNHMRRTALEQAVGEPAGGGADVERPPSGHIDSKMARA